MPLAPGSVFNVQGIDFQVLVDGYSKGIGANGPWRKVRIQCDWNDSDNLHDALMGVGAYTASGSTWTAVNPYRYPHNTNLRVLEVSGEGVGSGQPDAKLIAYDLCHLDVHFGIPAYSADGTSQQNFTNGIAIPWSRVDIASGVEEYSVRDLITDTGVSVARAKVSLPVQTINFRRGKIPYFKAYQDVANLLVGSLNSATFFGYTRGQLMFVTFDAREDDPDPDGTFLYDFNFLLKARSLDWNKELTPGSALGWTYLIDPLTTDKRYAYKDFSPLVNFGLI